MNELPKRKQVRLKDYDYSDTGSYFITICTKDRQKILCNIVGRDDLGTPNKFKNPQLYNKHQNVSLLLEEKPHALA